MSEPDATPSSGLPFPKVPEVLFTHWREALHRSGLSPGVKNAYALALGGYLDYCKPRKPKLHGAPVSKPA